jgi:transketolase
MGGGAALFPPSAKGTPRANSSGQVLNALAPLLANLIGGSADLAASNKTTINGAPSSSRVISADPTSILACANMAWVVFSTAWRCTAV